MSFDFASMMGSMGVKITQANTLSRLLKANPSIQEKFTFSTDPIRGPCFRIRFKNPPCGEVPAVSVGYPFDVEGETIEIALVGPDDSLTYVERLGIDDVYRFETVDELVIGLLRLADNKSVVGSEPVIGENNYNDDDSGNDT
jgi:hypothetical protein